MSGELDSTVRTSRRSIYVVDDDPLILAIVTRALVDADFEVQTARSAQHAFALLERHGLPHLAIVDLQMPDMDGFAFCQAIQGFAELPIIMLTATTDEDTIVNSLEAYAEDYITKPFHPRELVARVERVLRRIGDFAYSRRPITRIDPHLAIDFVHKRAYVAEKTVSLTPIETKLLYRLMHSAGQVVPTDFLLSRIWPREEVFEDALRVHIHRLREKIEPNRDRPHYIVTVRGSGYRFAVTPERAAIRLG